MKLQDYINKEKRYLAQCIVEYTERAQEPDGDWAYEVAEKKRHLKWVLEVLDISKDLEVFACDGVLYRPLTSRGREFLEAYGTPMYCCGYHGHSYSLNTEQ